MKIDFPEILLAIFMLLISIFSFKPAYDYTIFRLLIADVVIFFCALYFFGRRRPFFVPQPVLISLTGFVLLLTVSIAFSVFPPATLKELPHFLTYLLLFLVASQIKPTLLIIGSWIGAVVILSFTGLYDYNHVKMVVTPLGNKNFFAGYLILVVPITITTLWQKFLLMRSGRKELNLQTHSKKQLPRPSLKIQPGRTNPSYSAIFNFNNYLSLSGLILTVILFFVLLVLADSQAAYAGLASGLLFLALFSFGKFVMPRIKSSLRLIILLILIISLALTVFIGVEKGIPYILKNVRYPLWKGSTDMIFQKPITGFGPGTFLAVFQRFRPTTYYNRAEVAPLSDHSHNEYLELASESGLPALFLFLTFLASILTFSIRKMKSTGFTSSQPKTGMTIPSEWFLLAGIVSGLIAVMIDGLFSTNLRTYSVIPAFWLLLGFCSAIITGRIQTPETGPRKDSKTDPVSKPGFPPQIFFVWIAIMVFSVFSAGSIMREIKGQVYYKQGIAARNAQNWPDAISKYRKALEIDPANLQAAYKLSYVYASANQTENAINLYREILRISPNFAKTYYNLALLSLKLNDKKSAVAYLDLGLHYDPYDTEVQKLLTILTNPAAKISAGTNPEEPVIRNESVPKH